jgi:hypothetical protein
MKKSCRLALLFISTGRHDGRGMFLVLTFWRGNCLTGQRILSSRNVFGAHVLEAQMSTDQRTWGAQDSTRRDNNKKQSYLCSVTAVFLFCFFFRKLSCVFVLLFVHSCLARLPRMDAVSETFLKKIKTLLLPSPLTRLFRV